MEAENSPWPEIPLSALQHWRVCPRQCALIHLAGVWEENRLTIEGKLMHERVHADGRETINGIRIEKGVSLVCRRLGLVGKSDVIEFPQNGPPRPVEYKHGRPKSDSCDALQLCGQAICLEEMLGIDIPCGSIYYGATRHRVDIAFTLALRMEVETTAMAIRTMLTSQKIPPVIPIPRCKGCSLASYCEQPPQSVQKYLQAAVETEC